MHSIFRTSLNTFLLRSYLLAGRISVLSAVVGVLFVCTGFGFQLPGSLDPTFSGDGRVTTAIGSSNDEAKAIALQPDGKIVAAGISQGTTSSETALARYNADGSLDTSFGGDGKVTTPYGTHSRAYAIAIQSDGKIVAAGDSGNPGAVFRYNADGSLDITFDNDGVVLIGFDINNRNALFYAVAIQPDNKILVAGYYEGPFFAPNLHTTDFALARLNPDGSLDTSFGTNGKVLTNIGGGEVVNALIIQPDGKIVAAGWTESFIGGGFALVRYTTNGSLDATFGNNGKVITGFGGEDTYGIATSAALQHDGKIVAAGDYRLSETEWGTAVVRYNSNGSLDNSFDNDGIAQALFSTRATAYGVAIQSNGRIVTAFGNPQSNSSNDFEMLRYNSNGSLDASFGVNGRVTTDFRGYGDVAQAVAIQPNGRIVVAGLAQSGTSPFDNDFAVARYIGDAVATAATVSGRVTRPGGNGLQNATVLIADSQGITRTATTSTFGYYTFDNVPIGQNYQIGVSSRRYRFIPRQLQINGNLTDIDFVGQE